jgi:hypothetical protein
MEKHERYTEFDRWLDYFTVAVLIFAVVVFGPVVCRIFFG